MSDDDERTTVEARDELTQRLLDEATTPKYEGGTPNVDPDDDEAVAFTRRALREIVELLAKNRYDFEWGRGNPGIRDYDAVDEMLDNVGIEEINVRSNGWHSPKVTVWLEDHPPRWANTATRREFHFATHDDVADHNGSPAHAVIDVRPF